MTTLSGRSAARAVKALHQFRFIPRRSGMDNLDSVLLCDPLGNSGQSPEVTQRTSTPVCALVVPFQDHGQLSPAVISASHRCATVPFPEHLDLLGQHAQISLVGRPVKNPLSSCGQTIDVAHQHEN